MRIRMKCQNCGTIYSTESYEMESVEVYGFMLNYVTAKNVRQSTHELSCGDRCIPEYSIHRCSPTSVGVSIFVGLEMCNHLRGRCKRCMTLGLWATVIVCTDCLYVYKGRIYKGYQYRKLWVEDFRNGSTESKSNKGGGCLS